ncbi:YpdA family putative bacillithiol disulfide reductase [Lewinella sp. W8]|uniref:YpdA family putative bacillithiol disulfide reductase n=1 Tax=Lewinella sp. W8 TaxID=2528208 RepID=UPI0010680BFF|nr:YpdA family putative bacillithiol disulfide reductase [Lewinella sp. W8]MTB49729.1 YpdA family putative bacillithiol disulfide reductase [Lewinella sp. W8]
MEHYDLIIIGGGPSGINVGISAEKAGLKYLILEKGMLVNSLFNFPVNMTFFSTSLKLEIHQTPFISHGDKPTRAESLEYYRRLVDSFNLNLHLYEAVEKMEASATGGYVVTTEKDTYAASYVCVATGFYDTPNPLDVPGEDLPKVKHYYDDPHAYIGQEVVVVGAANSACDAALECWRKGAHVTMVIRGAEISPRVKYWIRPDIENRIKEGSIKAYFHSELERIEETEVVVRTPEGTLVLPNDFVLAMTGYRPNYDLLERLGLPIDEEDACKPIFRKETLETTLPGVYMAGVVCAGLQTSKLFIENTRDHGDIIVGDIVQKQSVTA